MAPTVWVASTTNAAPTSLQRAPIISRWNSVPSVQCAGSTATSTVLESIARTTASFQSAARLAPVDGEAHGAAGANTPPISTLCLPQFPTPYTLLGNIYP